MSFLSKIFSSKNSIKNGGTGTFFGKLIRGASSAIPIVGGAVSGMLNEAAEKKAAEVAQKKADELAAQQPTVANITSNAGMPTVSSVFPNGANATQLNDVTISANRMQSNPVNTDFSLDWKNGKISSSSNSGTDNKMLLYGLLGLGAIMMLNKK